MLSRMAPMLMFAALASCGARSGTAENVDGGKTMDTASVARLSLTSDTFQDGQPIPAQYTCDGAGQAPALHWGDPPARTKSFALVIDDPDAPSGTFRHWGVYDIPAAARSIGGGQRSGTVVNNDKGTPGYTGPCPPRGNGIHHYHFKLFALDVEKLEIPAGATVADVETKAQKHAIAQGELIGTYERR